jgi:hypothetical protein
MTPDQKKAVARFVKDSAPQYQKFDDILINKICCRLRAKVYKPGQVLKPMKAESFGLYLVLAGQLTIYEPNVTKVNEQTVINESRNGNEGAGGPAIDKGVSATDVAEKAGFIALNEYNSGKNVGDPTLNANLSYYSKLVVTSQFPAKILYLPE